MEEAGLGQQVQQVRLVALGGVEPPGQPMLCFVVEEQQRSGRQEPSPAEQQKPSPAGQRVAEERLMTGREKGWLPLVEEGH